MKIVKRIAAAILAFLLALPSGLLPSLTSPALAVGFGLDKTVSTHQSSSSTSVTSPAFTTSQANELLVAFIASDGPKPGTQSMSAVTGGGLTWTMRKRTNAQAGTAEIWTASATSVVTNATVKATHSGSYTASITVATFTGASTTIGAVGGGNATTGAPTASLTTTMAGSWVWAVGDDWDNATARTVGANQTKVDEFLAPSGDTFWTQRQTTVTPASGTVVTINDTAPTTDRWNLSMIEILPAVTTPDTTAPSIPTGLTANAAGLTQVNLGWTAATDNVGVTGYKVLRDGAQIATTTGTIYSDTSVAANTSYSYTVRAYDAAGNTSADSNAASVTTPAPDTTAPVISNVNASAVTGASATISWTTDELASTQIAYGTTNSYGSTTILNSSLVTSHSQNLSGLSAGTTYHYAVMSKDASGNLATSADSTFTTTAPDTTAPTVQLSAPIDGATVSGVTTVSATASDDTAVVGVQFLLDGSNLGTEVASAPYNTSWNTATATNGSHVLSTRARDAAGNLGTAVNVTVTVNNPVSLAPTIDPSTPAAVGVMNNVLTTTSPSFSPPAGTVVYAAFSMDSASYTGVTTFVNSVTNSGTPLTWHLLGRENGHSSGAGGFVEVWWAYNPSAQTNITTTATFNMATKNVAPPVGDFQVIVMNNAAPDQSTAAWSSNALLTSKNNAPFVNLTTTKANSQVFAVFDNWDNSETPIPGANQSITSMILNPTDRDGYWLQKQDTPTAAAGTNVLMNATDPGIANEWHALAWEVLGN